MSQVMHSTIVVKVMCYWTTKMITCQQMISYPVDYYDSVEPSHTPVSLSYLEGSIEDNYLNAS